MARAAFIAQDHPHYKWVALSNTTLGMLMATINASIVIISLPAIFRGIRLDPLEPGNVSYLLWMLMGYLLVTAVLVVTFGRLGDMYGRVRIYNLGFVVFTARVDRAVAGPVRPAVRGALWLIGWRVVQGVGGAMLFANSTAILTDAFPADQRGMALGINQVAAIAGCFIGLLAGGLLAGVRLAGGVLGQRARRRARHRLGVPLAARDRRPQPRPHRLAGQHHLRGRPDASLLTAITYGIQPYGGQPDGLDQPVGARLASSAASPLLALFCVDRDARRRPRCSTCGCSGSGPSPWATWPAAGRDRPRRPAVHADHLAAGHLAAAARLRLRGHPAVGRHLPAAADGRLPGRRAAVRHPVRPVRRRGFASGAACCSSRRRFVGLLLLPVDFAYWAFAPDRPAERHRVGHVLRAQPRRRS